MAARHLDPTRTLTIRNKAVSEINRRFNAIKQGITRTLIKDDILANAKKGDKEKFVYLYGADKLTEFIAWLHERIDIEILETKARGGGADPKRYWLNAYIGISYERGAKKTRAAIGRKFVDKGIIHETSIFANPAHVDRAELIYTRVYSQLKGVTEAMEGQIARELSDGMIKGHGVKKIARKLNNRVDKIGKVRSRLIARTEIVNAHNLASLAESESLEDLIDEEVKMKWLTALDGRERPSHRARHNKIYTKEEAAEKIGDPNCRCSITAWLDEFGELENMTK